MKNHVLVSLIILFIIGCNDDDIVFVPPVEDTPFEVDSIKIMLNPSGVAPLTAKLTCTTSVNASVEIRVRGKNGISSDVVKRFPSVNTIHDLMILGLYADHENEIQLTFFNESGTELGTDDITVQTDPLISALPQIDITTKEETQMAPGMNFVNYYGHDGVPFPVRPFMFDNFGDIRWYLDYSSAPALDSLFTAVGMFRLQNGNLIFGNTLIPTIYEANMYGEIQDTWDLTGYSFHHTVIEKPDGNLIVTVTDETKQTEEDVIIELDRTSGAIVNTWDLTVCLDPTRQVWNTNLADITEDWFHANALVWDESDNTLIVSGRTQGVVKLTENNEVVWILAPHKGWSTASNGIDLNQYLLQPLDAQGNTITSQNIIEGEVNHPDFEWNWYQHGHTKISNGNLILFDNGDNRNYTGNPKYSRAVEFKIDEINKTVQQIWQYGKERGEETYSRIVSKVTYDENTNNVLFSSGAITYGSSNHGKAIEINKTSNMVVFEAKITPPQSRGLITLHNVLRIGLYPN